jgi:BMFP domain-containing protein YqiC
MSKLSALKDLASKMKNAIPEHLQVLKDDLNKNCNFIAKRVINKLNLVTREEFEVQSKVLARTRSKLKKLEDLMTKSDDHDQHQA